jgi:hypothetical protein
MSTNVIPFEQASQLPTNLAAKFGAGADDLIASSGGFPVISIRGSKFRLKTGGDEVPLVDGNTGDPLGSLEIVIIKPASGLSKNYYAKDYVEGDDANPDCFSINGEAPDSQVKTPQCKTCAACPHNVWGSKISPNGNETKACSDSKLMAVTFAAPTAEGLRNEAMGGPMMLRVPAASLKDMTAFGRGLKGKGFVPQQVVTRIGFDLDASYPKLTFKAARPLGDDLVAEIGNLYDSEAVAAITEAAIISQPAAPAIVKQPTVDTEFDAPDVVAQTVVIAQAAVETVVPTAVVPKRKAAVKKAAPKPQPEAQAAATESEGEGDVSSAMDDILGELDGLI